MKTKLCGLVVTALFAWSTPANAATFPYSIYAVGTGTLNATIPVNTSIIGTIWTDCENCHLQASNIVSYYILSQYTGSAPDQGFGFSPDWATLAISGDLIALPPTSGGIYFTGPGSLTFDWFGSIDTVTLTFSAKLDGSIQAQTFFFFPDAVGSIGTGTITTTYSDSLLLASTVPLPSTSPLFATGLGALGLLGWRRKRKLAAA